jgi:hypothetical protein
MQLAQRLAGYTLSEADLMRRAMGKKRKWVDIEPADIRKMPVKTRQSYALNLVARRKGNGK